MNSFKYRWTDAEVEHAIEFVEVRGTNGQPYRFGEVDPGRMIDLPDFYIGAVTVTQAFWRHVMGAESNPAGRRGGLWPVENVSWESITAPGGFLSRLNASPVLDYTAQQLSGNIAFRLPSETEWEYAARGGPHWHDGFRFSGSNDIESVAWYQDNSGDLTHAVAEKGANQLGIYDMSGNIWEWCQDAFTRDIGAIPSDGKPFEGASAERVLRGGCYHNWAIHCTVSKRYEIASDYRDGCIGFRLVLSAR
jgi:sulfatase modifying factor 1